MLTLISWLRECFSGFSRPRLPLPAPAPHTVGSKGSHYAEPTLRESGVRLHLLGGRISTYIF